MATARLLALLLVGLLIPTVQAQVEADCDPPCGYIVPLLDMDFPTKPSCSGTSLQVVDGNDYAGCAALFEDGEKVVYEGVVTIEWEVSEEGTYPKDTGDDIILSFGGSSSNHRYLKYTMEPSEFYIDDVELLVNNYETREKPDGSQAVWFYYEQPITLTIERAGDPTDGELKSIRDRDGLVHFFIKASTTESSSRFKSGFAVEEFRFNALANDAVRNAAYPNGLPDEETSSTEDSPGVGFVGLLALIGIAALRRRHND